MKNKKNTILFKGDLIIENASEIKEQIKSQLRPNNSIFLKFEKIESIDLSFVQIIMSLKKYANQNNIKIIFENVLPLEFSNFIKKFGITI